MAAKSICALWDNILKMWTWLQDGEALYPAKYPAHVQALMYPLYGIGAPCRPWGLPLSARGGSS